MSFRAADRLDAKNIRISGVAMPYTDALEARVFSGGLFIGEIKFGKGREHAKWDVLVPATAVGLDNIVSVRFEFSPPVGCTANCFADNPGQLRLGMISMRIAYE